VDFLYIYTKQIECFGQCGKPSDAVILALPPEW
jgi:hypothetical protein